MENRLRVFTNGPFFELKDLEKASPYNGFVYIVEFGDKTKIGCTTNPSRRIGQLKATAAYGGLVLGRIALTPEHTNYREIESLLHGYFAKYRVEGTELFKLGFDEILASLPELPLKNESLCFDEQANAFVDAMKGFLLGATDSDNVRRIFMFCENDSDNVRRPVRNESENDSDKVRCPVCNEICDTIYMDKNGKVFACDNCVIDQDSYTWNFEKHKRYRRRIGRGDAS